MSRGRITAAVLGCVLALSTGCDRNATATRTLLAFGTLVEVTLPRTPDAQAEEAISELDTLYTGLHEAWHPTGDGDLGRFNAVCEQGGGFAVSESLRDLVQRARPLSRATTGLFNPAIGSLVRLWGFDDSETLRDAPPAKADIERLVSAQPTLDDLEIDGPTMRCKRPLTLDFGAYAKGIAVERGATLLRAHGLSDFIINAGGDLKASGSAGPRPWRVGIRAPRGSGLLAGLDVHDGESVFTSGDYERLFVYQGHRYHHILDPRTGYPASDARSVTVIHRDAGAADAYATALFVAGDEWPLLAERLGLEFVLFVDASGHVAATGPMADRVQLLADADGNKPVMEVIAP